MEPEKQKMQTMLVWKKTCSKAAIGITERSNVDWIELVQDWS